MGVMDVSMKIIFVGIVGTNQIQQLVLLHQIASTKNRLIIIVLVANTPHIVCLNHVMVVRDVSIKIIFVGIVKTIQIQ
jgi:hypothetical protein